MKPNVDEKFTIEVEVKCTRAPNADHFSIGMSIQDTEVIMTERGSKKQVGSIIACMGGGILSDHGKYSFGINMGDIWRAIAERLDQ